MTEEPAAAFQRDGDPAFSTEGTTEETVAAPQAGDENQDGDTHSEEGDDKNTPGDDKNIPFHEHPRWKQREEEWTKRFNEQETRHAEEVKGAIEGIRKEFGDARKDNASAKIPSWFGGTQEQWDDYKSDRDAEIKQAEDRAVKAALDSIKGESTKEAKAVEEATTYMRSEMAAIEADKGLNPTGAKIEAEKLLRTVLDNQLIDTQGRWNYRAGWKILTGQTAAPKPKPSGSDKKDLADATAKGSAGGGDPKPKPYMTSADFKRDRPW